MYERKESYFFCALNAAMSAGSADLTRAAVEAATALNLACCANSLSVKGEVRWLHRFMVYWVLPRLAKEMSECSQILPVIDLIKSIGVIFAIVFVGIGLSHGIRYAN